MTLRRTQITPLSKYRRTQEIARILKNYRILKNLLKNYRKRQRGEEIEQNNTVSKNGKRNNKSQRERTLKIENQGKRSGVMDASITNRM